MATSAEEDEVSDAADATTWSASPMRAVSRCSVAWASSRCRHTSSTSARARRQREAADAAAAARLAAARAEVEEMCRQRDEAQATLHRLTARMGEALQVVASAASETPNIAADVAVLTARREPLASSAS